MDFYAFYRGQEFEAYTYLGAHTEKNETIFRTFAPSAVKIALIGEFSNWQEIPMKRVYDGNFWECSVKNTKQGQMYKYRIYDQTGGCMDHCDPYANMAELRPGTASKLYTSTYALTDDAYMKRRKDYDHMPMHIYEIQAGAWRLPDPSNPEKHYTYRELADLIIPYLEQMHYNFLEMMPVTEYPTDESWGYQTTGFFAPTSRYGTPDDLKYLIDQCHRHNIGVIADFVAVHFSSNGYGLQHYDGTALYEYPSNDVGRSEWGTSNFMHSRGEVRSFLQSSVSYWLAEFHFDGIRVDAVSNLIYWQGDTARGVNQAAVQFLRTMNAGLKERFPNALLIAEDSSSYPGVTKSVEEGGLGFDYKWDLGWMNDTLAYMKIPPEDRKYHYHKLTFSIYYYYHEKYLLPLSHDEVVHGKASIVQKMNGSDLTDKFSQARLLFAYMLTHPGKKLNFMGNELGGPYEWSEKKEIDWWLLRDRKQNRDFYDYMKDLNEIYLKYPAWSEEDYEYDGFEWTDCGNEGKNAVYAYVRRNQKQSLLAVFNFDQEAVEKYVVKFPDRDLYGPGTEKTLKISKAAELLDSSEVRYGGTSQKPAGTVCPLSEKDHTLTLDLPGFSARLFLLE